MLSLLQPFLGNLLLSLVLFVVLFVVLIVFLAREKAGALVVGLVRVIASFFTSPFAYLRKAIARIAGFTGEAEARYRETEQYLLHKLLLALAAIAMLVSIGILTAGGVAGWNHGREMMRLNREAAETRKQLAADRAERDRLVVFEETLDSQWTNGRDALVAAFMKTRARQADSLDRANVGLEAEIRRMLAADTVARDDSELFQNIANYLRSSSENPGWYYGNVRENVRSAIERRSMPDELKTAMKRYTENWYQARMSMTDPYQMGSDQLRRVLQPTRLDSLERKEALAQSIPATEARLDGLQRAGKERAVGAVREPVVGFFKFLLFVWGVGLAIEALGLGVLTATNIQRMRECADGGGAVER